MRPSIVRLPHKLIVLLCVATIYGVHAQEPQENALKTPYYLDLDKGAAAVIHELQEGILHLQYHDLYGQASQIPLKVYDWKREEVAVYNLSKTYGLNHYSINLQSFFNVWKEDEVYSFEVSDELYQRYTLLVRKIAPPEKEKPMVNIFVNPLHLSCKEPGENTVEFYGNISGGKPPYKIHWYIMNDRRATFLYQPREEVIARSGKTPVIRVDKDPDYFVLLHVRDACGNEQQQMVNLVCEDEKRKINTLFIEPVKKFPPQPKTGN